MGASPASAIALAAARRAALDDSRGIVADAQRQQPRAPYIVPESQRTGFKIRIKRPLGQGVGDAALAGIIAGGSTVGRLAASAATLVVTPASILRQWLQEIERHAPSLASRVLVYPGMRELGKRADARRLAQAMDRAYIVITTYRVLKQEVLYSGEDGDGADGSGGSAAATDSASASDTPCPLRRCCCAASGASSSMKRRPFKRRPRRRLSWVRWRCVSRPRCAGV